MTMTTGRDVGRIERLLNSTPYRQWPAFARAMGWAEPDDPDWMPVEEREWTWRMIRFEEARAARERERQEVLAEVQSLIANASVRVLGRVSRVVRRLVDRDDNGRAVKG